MPFQNTHKAAFYRWLSDGELVGSIAYFAGQNSVPDGWVLCDGAAISRETYATLFSAIGTTYGAGDGSTTFALPNLLEKFVEGSATAGTWRASGLPNITGDRLIGWGDTTSVGVIIMQGGDTRESGALYASGNKNISGAKYFNTASASTEGWHAQTISFDASRSNSIYGNSTTVQPPAVTMRPFMYTGKTTVNKWLRTA